MNFSTLFDSVFCVQLSLALLQFAWQGVAMAGGAIVAVPDAGGCVSYVVEKGTGKAIVGATVEVRFLAADFEGRATSKVLAAHRCTTDHEGRYTLQIPADLAERSDYSVCLDVHHPAYASVRIYHWASEMGSRSRTETRSVDRIELYPGARTTGRVETPDGQPAVGVRVGGRWTAEADAQNLCASPSSSYETVTDQDGRFSVMLPKVGASSLRFLPERFAPSEHVIQDTRGDLGVFRLENGFRVKGEVLDLAGQPVTPVPVEICHTGVVRVPGTCLSSSAIRRATLTDGRGQFEFRPLPAGSYSVHVSRCYDDPVTQERRYYQLPGVVLCEPVVLKDGTQPTPVVLQTVPHVTITARFVDGRGDMTLGPDISVFAVREFTSSGRTWSTGVMPDAQGKAVMQVPKGGIVQLNLVRKEELAIKYRTGSDLPLRRAWDGRQLDLGTVDSDMPDVLIYLYAAPRLAVRVTAKDGGKLAGVKVTGMYRGGAWGVPEWKNQIQFDRQPSDGRYCSRSMAPDEEITVTAAGDGYAPQTKTFSLREGEVREIELGLVKP